MDTNKGVFDTPAGGLGVARLERVSTQRAVRDALRLRAHASHTCDL